MINENSIEYFNSRLTFDYTKTKELTPSQKDKVRVRGSQAENLLKNKDFAMFIHQYKFEIIDQLSSISGHSIDDNAKRIALSNELVGIDGFINTLKRAIYYKDKIGNQDILDMTAQ